MAEKKDIAQLDFNINDAINSLEKVDKKLKSISDSSEAYAKKIGKNLGNAINSGNLVDSASVNKALNNVNNLSKTKADQLSVQLTKIKAKEQADINKIVQKGEQDRQTAAYKTALKQEQYNNKVLDSTKTIYDKISDYAKTYIIYQGFNELRKTITELIDEMVEMEYQMVQIDRVLSDSTLDINKYRDELIQLAFDYGNSFNNVADITLRLAQAGFDAQESIMMTEKTLLALNTAELDATQATEDMVAVMAQWGLMTGTASEQAESYGSIIDKINKVADNFPTTSEDILNALKKTSSAFNLAGASIDETIALITAAEVASQRGGKAIGTALSNIVQQLKDAGRLTTIESLGIEVYTDATKTQFNSVIDIIGQLSEKMQELKNQGKENSAEMQRLLEVFTVFRRNIGAGLLGEMAGEQSTYAQALETSIKSIGYSFQENEKHMRTAKAAQEQFNAELLKLKVSVWDNGVENVFRSMLLLGTDVVGNFTKLIDTFGALPVVMAAATLAFSLLSKKMKIASLDIETGTINVKGFVGAITNIRGRLTEINNLQNALRGVSTASNVGFKTMAANVTAYSAKVVMATVKTMALKAATMALNVAASLAATAGIIVLTTAIQEMMNKYSAAVELQNQAIQKTEEEVDSQKEKINSLKEMATTYDELAKKENRTPEEVNQLYELQLKIKNILGEQAETIDLINGKYDEQKKILNDISIQEQEKVVEEQRKLMEQKQNAGVRYSLPSFISRTFGDKDYESAIMEYGGTGLYEGSLKKTFDNASFEEVIELFTKWEENLRSVQGQSVELANTYAWVSSTLDDLTDNVEQADEATRNYYDSLARLDIMKMFPEGSITNVEEYNAALEKINQTNFDVDNIQEYRETLINMLSSDFPEFVTQSEVMKGTLEDANGAITTTLTSLQNLSDQYAMLKNAQDEYNSTGEMTISTLQGLINNDLLQYLSIQNGQLQINTQSMLDLAEAKKVEAIQALQSAASNDIEKAAIGDVASMSDIARGAVASVGNNAAVAGNQAQTAAGQMAVLAQAMQDVADAAEGNLGEGVDLATFRSQANAIMSAYQGIAKNISSINIRTASYSPQKASGSSSGGSYSGGSSSAAAKQAQREAEQAAEAAQKAEEEAYKKRLSAFTDYIKEQERLEKRWVDKQKELGQLSNEDFLYIIQQRIERYKKYLDEVKKATWMNQEDRLELEKEYSEEIEDLQVDYLGYLQDQLDEEIQALEDANEEKIKLIEEEADARIAALKKVSDSTNRNREEETYQKERQSILDEISYWEQRTGREAQEALVEARKKLEELDEEWKEQLEDWSIEDQIQAIEDERDAQVKAIQDAQAAEIASMQEVYDAKVKMFAETGQIIYEGSVIQSQKLYSAYKQNFIDPISSDLAKLNQPAPAPSTTTTTAPKKTQQYETYTIKYGDTLTRIANNFGTTIEKIMAANPYVTNKNRIYAGKTLQIPKFHNGGIVGGNQEAFALLKPNEVILKPEWADGINKLAQLVRKDSGSITNSTVVEVKGDMVKIEANIKDKTDAEYLTRRIEKMLKDKFNVKK